MMRTFAGKLGSLAALVGFVALLAGAGYTLVADHSLSPEPSALYLRGMS